MPNWSATADPDAPAQEDNSWVEAFRGINNAAGYDVADALQMRLANGPADRSFTETELRQIAERITNMRTLIEQQALVRLDDAIALNEARTEAEVAVANTRQATAGVRMGENMRSQSAAATEKINAARAERAKRPPRAEGDRAEANPLGGAR